jgi:hypothetical protein
VWRRRKEKETLEELLADAERLDELSSPNVHDDEQLLIAVTAVLRVLVEESRAGELETDEV